jgi:ankyrin repeat protein
MRGSTALHIAAEAGAEDAAKVLLPKLSKEHVNQRNLHLSEYSQGGYSFMVYDTLGGLLAAWRDRLRRSSGRPLCFTADSTDQPTNNPSRHTHRTRSRPGSWLSNQDTIMPWDKTALAIAVETGDEGMTQLLLDAGGCFLVCAWLCCLRLLSVYMCGAPQSQPNHLKQPTNQPTSTSAPLQAPTPTCRTMTARPPYTRRWRGATRG